MVREDSAVGKYVDRAGPVFSITDKGEAFMRNLWMKYGDKSITVDMMKFQTNKEEVFNIEASPNHASFPKRDKARAMGKYSWRDSK